MKRPLSIADSCMIIDRYSQAVGGMLSFAVALGSICLQARRDHTSPEARSLRVRQPSKQMDNRFGQVRPARSSNLPTGETDSTLLNRDDQHVPPLCDIATVDQNKPII